MKKIDRLIFHVDVNSAFLSWTAVDLLKKGGVDLREIPSCIGGDPKTRTGIVVAKSIPAKKYGVTTGEPMAMALRKCPELVSAPADFNLYVKYSKAFKKICNEYTAAMESFSIDEVFLDMTGMGRIYPDPIKTAHEIKDRIYSELGFTVNVGIGENKLLAKMASDFEKPDKVHTLFFSEIKEKMWPLSVGELFTCGKASANKLKTLGINTIGELAKADLALLVRLLGDNQGKHLKAFANGIDDEPVNDEKAAAKGYSAETTVENNLEDLDSIDMMLLAQADVVAARMRAEDAKCRCISVIFRTIDFKNKSHQRRLFDATDITDTIYEVAKELIRESWQGESIRLIGLSLSDITREDFCQMSLFGNEHREKMKKLDKALDSIRGRFGNESVQRASTTSISKRVNRKHRAEQESE